MNRWFIETLPPYTTVHPTACVDGAVESTVLSFICWSLMQLNNCRFSAVLWSSGIMRDAAEQRYSIHMGIGDLFQFPVAAALPPGVSG